MSVSYLITGSFMDIAFWGPKYAFVVMIVESVRPQKMAENIKVKNVTVIMSWRIALVFDLVGVFNCFKYFEYKEIAPSVQTIKIGINK